MQRSESLRENSGEITVFDGFSSEFQNDQPHEEIVNIMDLPGTAHEKLVALSEMI